MSTAGPFPLSEDSETYEVDTQQTKTMITTDPHQCYLTIIIILKTYLRDVITWLVKSRAVLYLLYHKSQSYASITYKPTVPVLQDFLALPEFF